MSAVAGIYNVDSAPIDKDLLQRMGEIVNFRGPDGAGIWVNGGIGLAHRLLWNSEESIHEKQPMTNGRGLWITADCRIDNRNELKGKFEALGLWKEMEKLSDPFPPPDSAYILFAYELWGEESPNHLLGDFAFAIWDERNQKLFCARDQIGLKPFFYYWDGKTFVFGSEIKQIFQDRSISQHPNLVHLAEMMISCISNREETPYESIVRLPPAYYIRIENGCFELKKYWLWNPDEEPLSHASDEENAETFLPLFQESVRARLRVPSHYRTGSLLSGGLDSSSIVSIAQSIQKTSQADCHSRFPVFTLHFPEANPSYQFTNFDPVDESLYSEALIQKYGLEVHRVEIRGWGPLENFEENMVREDGPLAFPNFAYFNYLCKVARDSNIRVLLHGEGGDELFQIGSQCVIAEFKKRRFAVFFKEWLGKRKIFGDSFLKLGFLLFRVSLPNWVKKPYRRFIRKTVPSWINPVFAKKIALREKAEKSFLLRPERHPSASYGIISWLKAEFAPVYLEAVDRMASQNLLELRMPYLDLRLMRFLASIPWNQKTRQGVSKYLLRQAMKDSLPLPILNRLRKSEFTPVILKGLKHYAKRPLEEAFTSPHPLLLSITVPRKVRSLYQRCFCAERPPLKDAVQVWSLWYIMGIDQWLKHRESSVRRKRGFYEGQKRYSLANQEI